MSMCIVYSVYTWKMYVRRVELEISYIKKQHHCPKTYSQKATTGFTEVNRSLCYNKYKRERDFCKRIRVSAEKLESPYERRPSVLSSLSLVLQFSEAVCSEDHFVCEKGLRFGQFLRLSETYVRVWSNIEHAKWTDTDTKEWLFSPHCIVMKPANQCIFKCAKHISLV